MIEETNPELTNLQQIGEFGLIERIGQTKKFVHEQTIKGIGDDCAVTDPQGKKVLLSTDLLCEGVHFDLAYVPLKHLGYKAAVVNFSDMLAMNVKPAQLLMNIALSAKFTVEAVDELYKGIHAACEKYGVELIGGDTSSSIRGMVLSGTVIGYADEEQIVYRSGAAERELLCVTGDLGAAYAGLRLLEREKQIFKDNPAVQPDLSGNDYILERQLKPEARIDIITALAEMGIKPTAMMDISDGLASEIGHICKASGLGAHIYLNRIPVDPSAASFLEELKVHPGVAALNGGEDYELLFTLKQSDYEKISKSPDITIIGYMSAASEGIKIETPDGRVSDLTAGGWNAFQ
ncbi:MAG: thiamine-phosphate kinase [Bacteroidia bacterium]|nr:thiamine-phosphate kinase [Bacteroidia bacterium]